MNSPNSQKPELRGKTLVEMEALLQREGFKGFRAKQVYHWLYRHDIRDFTEMTNIPENLLTFLSENFRICGVSIDKVLAASDGSRKILFSLHDGLRVESVLMPQQGRLTLCVSTQVGCPLDCRFCVTALVGFKRNLTTAEIIDQVQCIRHFKNRLLTHKTSEETHKSNSSKKDSPSNFPDNIVLMGMGEPLLNLEAVIPALKLLTAPEGIAIPTRRITISTAGIVPGIYALAKADTGVNLAVSLNAATDELRNRLMPINKKYPISEIIEACRKFPLGKRRRITFEYIMLGGVNDMLEQAKHLAKVIHPVRCKVNLICYNADERLPFRTSTPEAIDRFREFLGQKGYTVAVRYSKGAEIRAACGQLAADYL